MTPPLTTLWYTDRGRRPSNEDAVIVETLFGDRDVIAVADGMGGHAGGEVASAKALETLLASLESSNDLADAIKAANAALLQSAQTNPEWRGMGTTIVALLRVGSVYFIANVGDSRAYRLDRHGLRRITEDHSFTAEAVNSGRLSEDEAQRSPWRNALTRAVGTDTAVDVDMFGPFLLDPPHTILLCTDGLYRVMEDDELAHELVAGRDRGDLARDLVANALRRGSNDNISVAVVEFGDVRSAPRPPAIATNDRARGTTDLAGVAQAAVGDLPGPHERVADAPASHDPSRKAATQELAGGPASTTSITQPIAIPEPVSPEPTPVTPPPPTRPEPTVVEPTAGLSPPGPPPPLEPVAEAGTIPSGAVVRPSEEPRTEGPPAREASPEPQRSPARPVPMPPPADGLSAEAARPPLPPAPRVRARRVAPPRKGLVPSWVKREGLPAALLVGLTLAVVYAISTFLG